MSPEERSATIRQLDKSFNAMPTWGKTATKHGLGAPSINPKTGEPFKSFLEVLESLNDHSLQLLKEDFSDNGDLLPLEDK